MKSIVSKNLLLLLISFIFSLSVDSQIVGENIKIDSSNQITGTKVNIDPPKIINFRETYIKDSIEARKFSFSKIYRKVFPKRQFEHEPNEVPTPQFTVSDSVLKLQIKLNKHIDDSVSLMKNKLTALALTNQIDTTCNEPTIVFTGSKISKGYIPPDIRIAVGPNHIMETTNEFVSIFSKTGTLISKLSHLSFFSGDTSVDKQLYDPHILYDADKGRWLVIIDVETKTGKTYTYLNISLTSNPTGNWYNYKFPVSGYRQDSLDFCDFPMIGYNKKWIVITYNDNLTREKATATWNSRFLILNRESFYNGTSSPITIINGPQVSFGVSPVVTLDSTEDNEYMIEEQGLFLIIFTINGTINNPQVSWVRIQKPYPFYSNTIYNIVQKGEPTALDGGSSMIKFAFFVNGFIWFAHTDQIVFDDNNKLGIRWGQIDPITSSIKQWGTIGDDSIKSSYFYPSLCVDRSNNVLISFGRSSPNIYSSAGYTYRLGSDLENTMRKYVIYQNGLAPYLYRLYPDLRNRWGDYFGSAVDPTDGSFWVDCEYPYIKNRWATSIAKVFVGCSNITSPTTINVTNKVNNNNGLTSCTIKWNSINGALGYKITYRPYQLFNSIDSIISKTNVVETNDTTINISLPSYSTYTLWVQSKCESGFSFLNSSFTFNTDDSVLCGTPIFSKVDTGYYFTEQKRKFYGINTLDINYDPRPYSDTTVIRFKKVSDINWLDSLTTTKSVFRLENLTPSSNYQYQIKEKCYGESVSQYSSTFNFTTLPVDICNSPYSELTIDTYEDSVFFSRSDYFNSIKYNFSLKEDSSDWVNYELLPKDITYLTRYTPEKSGILVNPKSHYIGKYQVVCPEGGFGPFINFNFTADYFSNLPSPPIVVSSVGGGKRAILTWIRDNNASYYLIRYRPSNTLTWLIDSVTSNSDTLILRGLLPNTTYQWQIQSKKDYRVRSPFSVFYTFTTSSSTCEEPLILSANNTTLSSTTLSWDPEPNATNYNLQYRVVGSSSWITISNITTPYVLTNLNSYTTYQWRVQTKCSVSDTSIYSTSFTFSTCPIPSNLTQSSVTDNSAIISWGSVQNFIKYDIRYKISSDLSWTTITGLTSSSYKLNNLNSKTSYEWQVNVTYSNNCVSNYSPSSVFITLDCPLPTGVKINSRVSNTVNVSWNPISGISNFKVKYIPFIRTGSSLNVYNPWSESSVTTNSITLTLPTNLITTASFSGIIVQVASICNLGVLSTYSNDTLDFCPSPQNLTQNLIYTNNTSVNLSWTPVVVNIDGYYLQFRVYGSGSVWSGRYISGNPSSYYLSGLTPNTLYEWRMATSCGAGNTSNYIYSTFTTGCLTPSGLIESNIKRDSVLLSWNSISGVSGYNLQYKVIDNPSWTTISNLVSNSRQLTSLIPNTTYQWRVQTKCSSSDTSSYSQPNTFTTLSCPTIPSGLIGTNIKRDSVLLSWNSISGVSGYNLQYKVSNGLSWTTLSNLVTNSYQLTNLSSNTTYQWRVQTKCSQFNSDTSSYSQPNTFTTLSCPIPSGLTSSNTTNSANLSWSSISGVIGYNLRYKVNNSPIWNIISNIPTNLYTLVNLGSGITYEWQVQTKCNSSDSSTYSTSNSFTTVLNCNPPTGLSQGTITQNSATISWTSIPNVNGYNIRCKISGTQFWSILAGTSNNSYTFNNLNVGTTYEWQIRTDCNTNVSSSYSLSQTFTTTCPVQGQENIVKDITFNSVNLNWAPLTGVSSYSLQYRVIGNPSWVTISNLTSNTLKLINLTPNTNYEWRVSNVCASTVNPTYGPNHNFTTLQCPIPTGLTESLVTYNSVNLFWQPIPNILNYDIQYKDKNTENWTTINGLNENNYFLSDLIPGRLYQWRVQSKCTTSDSSQYSENSFFRTLCPVPTGLNENLNTGFSANLYWTTVPDVEGYFLRYKSSVDKDWISAVGSINSNSYTLDNLKPGTTYEWQVKTYCGATSCFNCLDTSVYSSSKFFTTLCPIPTGLSETSITYTSAYLSWTPINGTLSNSIQYRRSGDLSWITLDDVTSNSYLLSNLQPSTLYEWRASSICNNDKSSVYSSSKFFATLCEIPTNLSQTNITFKGTTLSWNTQQSVSGYNLQYRVSSDTTWITIPNLTTNLYQLNNLISGTTYQWRVSTICKNNSVSDYSSYNTFTTLGCPIPTELKSITISNNNANLSWSSITGVYGYIFRYRNVDSLSWNIIDGLTSNSYLLNNLNSGYTYECQVQTKCGISISDTSSYGESYTFTTVCPAPPVLNQSNITFKSVTLSWTALSGVLGYNLRYRVSGVWTNIGLITNSYVLDNLTPNTTYEWQVQTKCTNVDSSEFTPSRFFTTSICQNPTGLSQSSVTENSANLSWLPISGVYGYNLQYKVSTNPFWSTVGGLTSNSYSLTGLNSGAEYQWRVQTMCTMDSSSSYSPFKVFTTSCFEVPTNLGSNNVTTNSAYLFWKEPISGAQGYNLRYKKSNSLEWYTITNIPGVSYNFTNLLPGLTYEWQVQGICGGGGAGLFSQSSFFLTKRCETPSSVKILSLTNSSATINWNVSENSDFYVIRYRIAGTFTWTTSNEPIFDTTFILSGLLPNTNYEVQVGSKCGTTSSTFSTIVKFKTNP